MINLIREEKIGKSQSALEIFREIINRSKKEVEIKMETKSRYEVIAELEEEKRNLIRQKDNIVQGLLTKR